MPLRDDVRGFPYSTRWADRLPLMIAVARMLKRRFAKIEWVKYTARRFRSQQNFVHAIYFHCGGLDLAPGAK